MTTTAPRETESVENSALIPDTIERLRSVVTSGVTRSVEWRETQIDGVLRFLEDHTEALLDAMADDLGRPRLEGWLADVSPSITEAQYVRKRLGKWAKPRRSKLPVVVHPGSARVTPEPLGVVLIIAPWNYPVNLVIEPLVAALAAGNTVVLKPSELSPATANVISTHLPQYLDPAALAIFEGGPEVSTALLAERFDYIFFTGSTAVGTIVMQAAAKHLTPVTLELGGKSPVVVTDDCDIEVTANRIAWGKGLNAGQTCIAPDYVLVTEKNRDALIDGISKAWTQFYGDDPASSPDFGRVVNPRHHQRLTNLLEGQHIAVGGERDAATNFFSPTIVVDPDVDGNLMTQEIFGPILPVITVDDLDSAIAFVNARPKPLALYVFGNDDAALDRVVAETSSGGVCVNHTLLHFTPQDLPFGGVGPSGMGRYHGKSGFDTFSNLKGVLRKPVRGETTLLYPPYGEKKSAFLRAITKLS